MKVGLGQSTMLTMQGSYGFVYLVSQDDGKNFALKRLLLTTPEQQKDTQREIRMLVCSLESSIHI